MVNRTLLLFVLLGGLFIVLCTVLLNAQLPENTPFLHFFITPIILIYCCCKATPCRVFALPCWRAEPWLLPACYCNK